MLLVVKNGVGGSEGGVVKKRPVRINECIKEGHVWNLDLSNPGQIDKGGNIGGIPKPEKMPLVNDEQVMENSEVHNSLLFYLPPG